MVSKEKTVKANKTTRRQTGLSQINKKAAGIDIGAQQHYVAVPKQANKDNVRAFGVFTNNLYEIVKWLKECGITTVAMESTGVYWIPLYEMLEANGIEPKLVDARKVKNVSGRKSDVLDCQWLQQLHSYGLLEGAFRPTEQICTLRGYMRQRAMLIKCAASHIQHMQKALQQMNLRLDNVVADITGQTALAIIKAILAGERDPKKLAENRHYSCRNSAETIAQSLVGNYKEEHLFALKQALELYEFYQERIKECDEKVEQYLSQLPHQTEQEPPEIKEREKRRRINFNVRQHLFKLTGVDLFQIPGLNTEILLTLFSELGTDMTRWPSEKHFASWLCLCPGTKMSGGRVISRKTHPSSNKAAIAFRQAAISASRTQTQIGAFYRRLKSRLGPAMAATATAHKIARLYYNLLKHGQQYLEAGANSYEEKYRSRIVNNLKRHARALGYDLTPVSVAA